MKKKFKRILAYILFIGSLYYGVLLLLTKTLSKLSEYAFLNEASMLSVISTMLNHKNTSNIPAIVGVILGVPIVVKILMADSGKKLEDTGLDKYGYPLPAGKGEFGTMRFVDPPLKSPEKAPAGLIYASKIVNGKIKIAVKNSNVSNLILGPPGSGKTEGTVIPSVLHTIDKGESLIISDSKGDIRKRTAGHAEKKGYQILVLNFENPTESDHWNPMQKIVDYIEDKKPNKAITEAKTLAKTLNGKIKDGFWDVGSQDFMEGLLSLIAFEAPYSSKHLKSVMHTIISRFSYKGDDATPAIYKYIESLPDTCPYKSTLTCLTGQKTQSGFVITSKTKLGVLSDEDLCKMLSKNDVDLRSIGQKPTVVYIVAPDYTSIYHGFASIFIQQSYQTLIEVANQHNGKLPIRVHYMLEEFGQFPEIEDFDKKITAARSRGIIFDIIIQDLQQITRYYKECYSSIRSSMNWLFLKTYDPETAKIVSEKLGKYTIRVLSENAGSGNRSNSTEYNYNQGQNASFTTREIRKPDELMNRMLDETSIFFDGNLPQLCDLTHFYKWPNKEKYNLPYPPIKPDDYEVPVWAPDVSRFENQEENDNESRRAKRQDPSLSKEDRESKPKNFLINNI